MGSVGRDQPFAVTRREVLFPAGNFYDDLYHPRYDLSPDDRRFVMIKRGGDLEGTELIMIENWIEELKAKVGN